jgi:hypothetical protein
MTVACERNPRPLMANDLSGQTSSSFLQSSAKDQTARTLKLDKVADCATTLI